MFSLLFLFRNNGIRDQLDVNNFRRCYGNFFLKVSFPNYLITASFKAHFQQLWGALTTAVDNGNLIWKTLTTAFERHLTIQDFTDMDQQMSSLHQYIWLIIVCFSFSQTNPVFKFNLLLIEKFSSQPIYLSTLRDSVNLKVCEGYFSIFHKILVPANGESYWR